MLLPLVAGLPRERKKFRVSNPETERGETSSPAEGPAYEGYPAEVVAQGVAYDFRRNRPPRVSRVRSGLNMGRDIFAPILGEVDGSSGPRLFGLYVDFSAKVVEFYGPHLGSEVSKERRECYICDRAAVSCVEGSGLYAA